MFGLFRGAGPSWEIKEAPSYQDLAAAGKEKRQKLLCTNESQEVLERIIEKQKKAFGISQ